MSIEQQIARDLDLCDLIEVAGSAGAKRKARKQRKAIFQHLRDTTPPEIAAMTDDELFAALSE